MTIARKAIAGLALLSALLFCALAAQGAAAAEHTSENTTAFTCVKGGGSLDFADEHCDETTTAGKGQFGHELIPAGKTEIEVTNAKTLNKTTEAEPDVFKAAVPGGKVQIICKTAVGTSYIENGGTGTIHKITGTMILELTNCEVKELANCKVKEPIVMRAFFMGVDQMGSEKNTMGVEFEPDTETEEGKAGTFGTITFEHIPPGNKCSLNGKSFPIRGTMIATPGGTDTPKPSPSARESGATLNFEPGNGMQSLKLGENTLELSGTLTTRMKGGGNPITLTTTT